MIIDLEALRTQRLKITDLRLGPRDRFSLAASSSCGAIQITLLFFLQIQATGLRMIQGLIPRHVLQTQGQVALNGITGDD